MKVTNKEITEQIVKERLEAIWYKLLDRLGITPSRVTLEYEVRQPVFEVEYALEVVYRRQRACVSAKIPVYATIQELDSQIYHCLEKCLILLGFRL